MSSVSMYHTSRNATGAFLFRNLAEKTKNPAKILVKTYDGPLWRSHYETMSPELVFRRTLLRHVRVMAWAVRLSSLCRLWRSCAGYKIDTMSYLAPVGRLSWLPVSFLLHVKYPLSYRIVCVNRRILGDGEFWHPRESKPLSRLQQNSAQLIMSTKPNPQIQVVYQI